MTHSDLHIIHPLKTSPEIITVDAIEGGGAGSGMLGFLSTPDRTAPPRTLNPVSLFDLHQKVLDSTVL